MKNTLAVLLLFFLFSCADKPKNIKVDTYLTTVQQSKLKFDVVRYIEDLPRLATSNNKFDTIFDKDYKRVADKLELLNAYKSAGNDTLYFAVSKIAPSLKLKKVTIAGKMVYDKGGKLSFYEEGFRTWKMEVPELKSTTEMLFQKYIQNEDLSEYYTKNSKGKFIIEFPDENNTYDSKSRQWIFNGNPFPITN